MIQRILQIGNVDFDTAAGDDYNFVFSGVADPADVVHMVDDATVAVAPRVSATNRPRQSQLRRRPRVAPNSDGRGLGEPGRVAQCVGAVGALPGEVVELAAEVAVGGGLLVDRPVQVELLAERARAQVELLADEPGDLGVEIASVPKVSTITETGCETPIA